MSNLDELQKLQNLKESGAITEEEFAKLKEEIMNKQNQPSFTTQFNTATKNYDVKEWCVFMHLSQLFTLVLPFIGLIAPVIMWQMKKDDAEEIDTHGKVIVNWVISSLIYYAISFVLIFVLVGVPFLIAVGLLSLIFPIIGALKAKEGKVWKYPLTITFIK